jgi:hypothetical protein
MNPSKTQILGTTLLLYFVLLLAGTIFKIMHLPYAEVILIIMFCTAITFIALAVYEVIQSSRINMNEKIMWVIGLLFLGIIGSALYWFSGRKRIVATVA